MLLQAHAVALLLLLPLVSSFLIPAHAPRLLHSRASGFSAVSSTQFCEAGGIRKPCRFGATQLRAQQEGNDKDQAAKLEAARQAARAAELSLLGDIDRMQEEQDVKREQAAAQAAAQEERMNKFEQDMKQVVAGQGKKSKELDTRGVRLDDGTEDGALDDQMIQKVLRGEKTESKKKQKQKDKLRTETGEELYMTEMAPGVEVSPWAAPEEGFDPMNPPLPSELKAKEEEVKRASAMPLPSELQSPTQQRLYEGETAGIEDEALFTIKSKLDVNPGFRPRKTPQEADFVPLGREDVDSLDDLIARDRAALKTPRRIPDKPLVQLDAAGALDEAGESLADVVGKALGVVVVADFFVILGFLGWLGLSIVYQFAFCGGLTKEGGPVCANPLYDSWYALWTPVIQPALGILMGSVIVQGTVRGLRGKPEGEE